MEKAVKSKKAATVKAAPSVKAVEPENVILPDEVIPEVIPEVPAETPIETPAENPLEGLKASLNDIPANLRTPEMWKSRMEVEIATNGYELVVALGETRYFNEWLKG